MEHRNRVLDTIAEYYNRQPLTWGGVDLFFVPGDGALLRMGDYVALFRTANDGQDPVFSEIWLIWPDPVEEGDLRAAVRTRLSELLERSRGTPPTSEQVDRLFERIQIVFPEAHDVKAVARLVRAAAARALLVVGRASVYRSPQAERPTPPPPMPGDAWAPHLHALMEGLRLQAEAPECYVVLDVDEEPPARRELFELLLTVENTAVASFTKETPVRRAITEAITRWRTRAAEGNLDAVLAELNADCALSGREKSLLRLQLYSDAGNAPMVRAWLESNRDLLSGLELEQAVHVAVLAEAADAGDVATELLARALDNLHRPAALELVLEVADRLGNEELVRHARTSLEAVAPDSACSDNTGLRGWQRRAITAKRRKHWKQVRRPISPSWRSSGRCSPTTSTWAALWMPGRWSEPYRSGSHPC